MRGGECTCTVLGMTNLAPEAFMITTTYRDPQTSATLATVRCDEKNLFHAAMVHTDMRTDDQQRYGLVEVPGAFPTQASAEAHIEYALGYGK